MDDQNIDPELVEVTSVQVLAGYQLRLGFSDGLVRDVDLEQRLRDGGPVFRPIYDDPKLFAQVRVDPELGTIVWPNDADMAPEVLHHDYAPANR